MKVYGRYSLTEARVSTFKAVIGFEALVCDAESSNGHGKLHAILDVGRVSGTDTLLYPLYTWHCGRVWQGDDWWTYMF